MESSNSSNSSFRLPNLGIEKLGIEKLGFDGVIEGKDGIEVDRVKGGLDGVVVGFVGVVGGLGGVVVGLDGVVGGRVGVVVGLG